MVGSQDQGRQVSPLVDEFCRILEKRANDFGASMELGGLGTLAAPYLITRGRLGRVLKTTRGERLTELGGLGLLAVPSAVEIYRSVRGKFKPHKPKS